MQKLDVGMMRLLRVELIWCLCSGSAGSSSVCTDEQQQEVWPCDIPPLKRPVAD